VRNGYVEDVSDAQLLEYAIKGMIAELDPHSAYLDANDFEELQANTSGEFGGVGLEVSLDDGYIKVVSPIDDTPSSRADIRAGDILIRIDDQSLKGMDFTQAVNLMRGAKGSPIKITVMREGVDQPIDFNLERDIIKIKSVRTRLLEDDYLYLRIAQFQIDTGKEVADKLAEHLRTHNTKGIILDLRNNPGGVLQASVAVVDSFLDGGLVVYTQGRQENSNVQYPASAGDISQGLPLVVLINDGSASASEIVAGALQDHKRAVILGTRSFGKGSVQSVIPISEDRAIKLTTARYYTPSGRSIQAQGIEPDVVVERAKVTYLPSKNTNTEADLARHLSNTKGGKESTSKTRKQGRITNAELLEDDNQLHEALNLLKGMAIFIARSPLPATLPSSEPAVINTEPPATAP
jgi:carboxyl-terminal processing protease